MDGMTSPPVCGKKETNTSSNQNDQKGEKRMACRLERGEEGFEEENSSSMVAESDYTFGGEKEKGGELLETWGKTGE